MDNLEFQDYLPQLFKDFRVCLSLTEAGGAITLPNGEDIQFKFWRANA